MAKQELNVDKIFGDVTKQTDQAVAFAALYQKQAEKMVSFWLDRSMEAVRESQAFAREWATLGNRMAADVTEAVTASVKDTARLFNPGA